jgi:hypothetical protein
MADVDRISALFFGYASDPASFERLGRSDSLLVCRMHVELRRMYDDDIRGL